MHPTMVVYNLIYLALVALGLAFLGHVFLSTRPSVRARRLDVAGWKRRETGWFFVVLALLAVFVAATILETPWRASAHANRQVVKVEAEQFGFTWSTQRVAAGRQVEFQLTAADVNHAFALYDPDDRFVAQAQMMPGHTNRLRLTLTARGTYTVRCLEYCGSGHHVMISTLEVV